MDLPPNMSERIKNCRILPDRKKQIKLHYNNISCLIPDNKYFRSNIGKRNKRVNECTFIKPLPDVTGLLGSSAKLITLNPASIILSSPTLPLIFSDDEHEDLLNELPHELPSRSS